jgi:hypothetical protein
MKNTAFKFFGIAAIAVAALFSSCADPCKDVTCLNGGECVEGICACAAGYEGTDCGTAFNSKFAGSFTVNETCTPSGPASGYVVTITASTSSATGLTFTGLYETPGAAVTGTVNANSSTGFTIARQALSGTALDIEGSGTINTTASPVTITMTTAVFPTGTSTASDNCTGTLTKN